MHSWHNDMDRALIEPCPSYMLYHFLNSATIKKIRAIPHRKVGAILPEVI